MITVDKSRARFLPWVVAAVLVLAVVAWAFNQFFGADAAALTSQSTQSAEDINLTSVASQTVASLADDVPVADNASTLMTETGMPDGVNAEEWASIQAATEDHPNPQAERQRLIAFLQFQHVVEAWQEAASAGDIAKQDKLGQALLNDLPVHLANAEISMPEAMMLCAAVSHAGDANEQMAQQKVEQCQVRLSQSLPAADLQKQRQRDVCEADWRDRQAQLTTAFMKQAPDVRAATQLQFEQSLQAARVAVFTSSGCAGLY